MIPFTIPLTFTTNEADLWITVNVTEKCISTGPPQPIWKVVGSNPVRSFFRLPLFTPIQFLSY